MHAAEAAFTTTISNPPITTKVIFERLLDENEALTGFLSPIAPQVALITDENVKELYGLKLAAAIQKKGIETHLFSFAAGEQNKTRQTKELLENQMLEHRLGKETLIVALGGGVVTDMAGYLASTYCRGVSLIYVPTSLLGMVDAAIGGKNGVNSPSIKNLFGTIYHPKAIFIDPSFLCSLNINERRSGTAEIIKYGLIRCRPLFEKLQKNLISWELSDIAFLSEIIETSIQIKNQIVEEDPREEGLRRILNFGHTAGHALESLENYQISHGEAIAVGMLIEAHISLQMHILSVQDFETILSLFQQYGFNLNIKPQFTAERMLQVMAMDKKNKNSMPRIALLKSIGRIETCEGQYCAPFKKEHLETAIDYLRLRIEVHP